MKQEILKYIKDCKEKGYEAETILKGLEAKLEIEQDTSENWEQKFDKWAESFVVDFVSDDAGEEYNVYLKDTPFYEEFKDFIRKTRQESFEEGAIFQSKTHSCNGAQQLAKSDLIDGLIKWKKANQTTAQKLATYGCDDAICGGDLIQHLKNLNK